MSCGLCALGPPNQGGLPSPEKKYKRADLAGGDRFWAGTRTVLQYDISWFFLGLGTWLLTVTGIETLILTLIHPSLYINTHTSISISYCYSYLNIKYIDLSLCGSSLPIHVIHPIPGPWLHANLAAQTNNYMRKRNRQLSFIHLRWSLSPFCLTHKHTDTSTHKSFYTQTLLHRCTSTRKHFYTQTSLHRNTLTHKPFYKETLLHTKALTHNCFYTDALVHTNTFTHKHLYTETLQHTNTFTHKHVLHTEAFTHNHV